MYMTALHLMVTHERYGLQLTTVLQAKKNILERISAMPTSKLRKLQEATLLVVWLVFLLCSEFTILCHIYKA